MNIENLENELKFANELGFTLNLDERLKLTIAYLKLNEIEHFDQVFFWGKIYGLSSDYYILLGLRFRALKSFPAKSFYFCTEDFVFSLLPNAKQEHKQLLESLKMPFSGQREKILKEATKEELVIINGEEYFLPGERLTELDRLAFVVENIEQQCHLIPKGAFKLTPTNELRYDETFVGLSLQTAGDLENYLHFREPADKESREKIERGEALMQKDFLDNAKDDLPKDCWSLQTDSSKRMVSLRNLVWPGFFAYHRVNSDSFGGCYFGDGIKNTDYAFII